MAVENRKVESIALGHKEKFQLKELQAPAPWNPRMVGVGRALPVLLTPELALQPALTWGKREKKTLKQPLTDLG